MTNEMGAADALSGTNSNSAAEPKPDESIGNGARRAVNAADTEAANRRAAINAYIEEEFSRTGKRITRTDIWKSARYRSRTEFQRWQRNDPRATKTSHQIFTRILAEKPHLK